MFLELLQYFSNGGLARKGYKLFKSIDEEEMGTKEKRSYLITLGDRFPIVNQHHLEHLRHV
jgi:hypothetical protein